MHPWNETTQALILPDTGHGPVRVGRVFRLRGVNGSDPERTPPPSPEAERPTGGIRGLVYRRVFDAPGACVRVPFGPFAALLWGQLAVPQRARPTDHFDCLVQVLQVLEPVPYSVLERVESAVSSGSRLHVLTRARAEALGLAAVDGVLPETAPEAAPPVLEPGQVLWSLTLLVDPTRDVSSQNGEGREDRPGGGHPEASTDPPHV